MLNGLKQAMKIGAKFEYVFIPPIKISEFESWFDSIVK